MIGKHIEKGGSFRLCVGLEYVHIYPVSYTSSLHQALLLFVQELSYI